MPQFSFTARNADGELISDSRTSADKATLVRLLRAQNLFPIAIEEKKPVRVSSGAFALRIGAHPKAKDTALLTRRLANLLGSGIVLSRALELLSEQTHQATLAKVFDDLHARVSEGSAFWQALSRHPEVFSPLYVNMVKAGELGGSLEIVMNDLADFTEREKETRDEILSILAYPLVLLIVAAATVVFLMTHVVPRMLFIFKDLGEDLPFITRMLIAMSTFVGAYWWLGLGLIGAGFFSIRSLRGRPDVRARIDEFLYRAPWLGELMQRVIYSRLLRVIGLMLTTGVAIVDALAIAKGIARNSYVIGAFEKIAADVTSGSSFSASLRRAGIVPAAVIEAVAVGEETGTLEASLLRIAAMYEKEVQQETKKMLRLIEPAIIVVLAAVVGLLVMAMLLPVFQMNLRIR